MDFIPVNLKIGEFLVLSALLLSLLGFSLSVYYNRQLHIYPQRLCDTTLLNRIEGIISLVLFFACLTMIMSLVKGDYYIRFVAKHSNSQVPLIFRISALWGGQEGSILFWSFLMSLIIFASGKKPPIAHLITFFTLGFFVFLSTFVSKAFEFMYPFPTEGREMNPLLQHFGMALHPVFLYIGLTSTVVPFALYTGKILSGEWNYNFFYRKWALFSWSFLTGGIVIGGWWAYAELGWGGYWAWDPVENASFLPWLTLTAFLHSAMFETKFRTLKLFNFALISLTYLLAMIGTFLVRSGLFISVHSFVQNPELGIAFIVFIFAIVAFVIYIPIVYSEKFKANLSVKSLFSREFFILVGVVLLLSMWGTVFIGTIFPVIYESFTGEKISFGKPFFNKPFAFLSLLLILSMNIGQHIPWGKATHTLKFFLIPGLLCSAVGITSFILSGKNLGIAISLTLISLGIFSIISEWIKYGVKIGRFFPIVAHLGFFIMAIGITFSQISYKEGEFFLSTGEEIKFSGYSVKLREIVQINGPNWISIRANFEVREGSNSNSYFQVHSEKRFYFTWEEPTTEAGIKWGFLKDFYIVFVKLERETGKLYIKVWENPGVSLIWIGSALMFFAGIGNFIRKRK